MKTILNPLAILLTACLLAGGCHRSPQPPDSHSGGAPAAGDPNRETPPQPPPKKYGWGLPIGDVSPDQDERNVYALLHDGECAAAKRYLDDTKVWQHFASPRDVLLTWAAVAFCFGDTATATRHYRKAESLGWKGLRRGDGPAYAACEYYKSAASLIEQRQRSSFSCPAGDAPPWDEPVTENRKDPR